MASESEDGNKEQQLATVLRREQRIALELLLIGYGDMEIAQEIGVRREIIWKWKHRDRAFKAELRLQNAMMTEAAAERLHGMLDQAVAVVQRSLNSAKADPKLAMSLLGAMGVLERGRELGRAEVAPASRVEVQEVDGDAELERVLGAVEAEAGGFERLASREAIDEMYAPVLEH